MGVGKVRDIGSVHNKTKPRRISVKTPVIIGLFLALVFFLPLTMFCQGDYQWSDPANMGVSNASQDRFLPVQILNASPKKVDVGATGNFNLTIPLMTVPGRNGLNYEIKLTYTPGIKVTQEASWVGLGWNLDIGSITRNILDAADNKMYPESNEDWFRDIYSLSCPAGSGKVLQFASSGDTSFQLENWRPWKISYDTSVVLDSAVYYNQNGSRILSYLRDRRFIVTTDDGTSYVFSLNAAGATTNSSTYMGPLSSKVNIPETNPFTHWYLTSIVSANYLYSSQDLSDYDPSYLPTNSGEWIRILWSYDGSLQKKKFYYSNHNFHPTPLLPEGISLDEITYPEYIITPLYIAQFVTEPEAGNPNSKCLDDIWKNEFYTGPSTWYAPDNSTVPWNYFTEDQNDSANQVKRRLKCIKLYRNTLTSTTIPDLGTPIEEVDFTYMPAGSGAAGRTTLQKVQVSANGDTLPSYQFTYWPGPTESIFSRSTCYDTVYQYPFWAQVGFQGWYNSNSLGATLPYTWVRGNSTDGKVWNLREIKYPSGGTVDFDYESNKYMVDFGYEGYSSAYNGGTEYNGKFAYGLGCRLTKQTISDGLGSSKVYTYSYSTSDTDGVGRIYADPVDLYDVFRNSTRRYYSSTSIPNDCLFNQTNHPVLYGKITETEPDGSKIASTYSVTGLTDNLTLSGSENPETFYQKAYQKRGDLIEKDYLNSSGIALRKEQFSKNEGIKNYYDLLYCSIWDSAETSTTIVNDQNGQNGVTMSVTSLFDAANGLLAERHETNSNGATRITTVSYPCDYDTYSGDPYYIFDPSLQAIAYQKQRNITNSPVEQITYNSTTDSAYSATINLDTAVSMGDGFVKVFRKSQLHFSALTCPALMFPSYSTGSSIIDFLWYDGGYTLQETYDKYDWDNDDLVQYTDANGSPTSIVWGYNKSLPIAEIQNSASRGAAVAIFDDGDTSSWSGPGGWTINGGAYQQTNLTTTDTWWTPKGCYNGGTLGDATVEGDIRFDNEGNYRYAGLMKYVNGTHYVRFELRKSDSKLRIQCVNGSNTPSQDISYSFNENQWYHLKGILSGNSAYLYLDGQLLDSLNNSNVNVGSGNIGLCTYATKASFDNIRFYPPNAVVASQTFDTSTHVVTQQSDANGKATYFFYDKFQRLIKKQNYNNTTLTTYNYYTASVPNYTTIVQYRSSTDSMTTKKYVDGLGREVQTQTGIGTDDIIFDRVYDALGRDSIVYKSFQYNTGHSYDSNSGINSQASDYYNNNVYSGITDYYPYTTTEYYADGRTKDIKPPGSPWQTHNIQYSYGENGASDVAGYSVGTLYKTSVTDENGVKTLQFQDYFENIIQTVTDSAGLQLKTQFTYDLVGRLTKSIPPNTSVSPSTYTYSTLGLLTRKNSPDAGVDTMIYDENGNLRFIKDGNHTGTAANNASWNSVKFGSGTWQQNLTLTMPGNLVINLYNYGSYSTDNITATIKTLGGTVLKTFAVSVSQVYGSSNIYLPKGTYQCVVTTSDYFGGDEFDWNIYCNTGYEFIYKKYDALNREIEEGEYISNSANGNFTQSNADNTSFPTSNSLVTKKFIYDTPSTNSLATGQRYLKGRLSETDAYRLGSLYNQTFYSYDEIGRVEWDVQSGLGYYPKKLYYWYDLQGNITEKGYSDLQSNYNMYTSYTYDQVGRMNLVETSPNSNMSGATQEAHYMLYSASGKPLVTKMGATATISQYYHYNERDWLTSDTAKYISTVKFWEHLGYNTSSEIGGTQQWNGNISWMTNYMYGVNYQDPFYIYSPTATVGYSYSYDNANRLTNATFGFYSDGAWDPPQGSYNMPTLSYDNNGNILSLVRNGSGTTAIDNLSYKYRPGTDIDTLITNSAGSGSTYTYDSNGNITSDSKHNSAFIIYDINNLPVSVYTTSSQLQTYAYDVNGARIRKYAPGGTDTYYLNGPSGNTELVQKGVYNNVYTYNINAGSDNIGQVEVNGGSISRYYYLKDHLGDVKMILNSSGGVDIYNDYYPFGLQMPGRNQTASADARYKYIGVEQDAETGYLATGARLYDSWSGRFGQTDDFDFCSPDVSPYSYSFNNPLLFTDASGDTAIPYYPQPGEYPPNSGYPLSGWEIIESPLGTISSNGGDAVGAIGVGGHGTKYIYQEKKEIWRGGTWAWRNNNPGNITSLGKFALRHGSIGSSGGFAVFPNYSTGYKALLTLIHQIYGKSTISDMMSKYAPPENNPTEKYIQYIVDHTGFDRNTIVNSLDANGIKALADGIAHFEGYRVGTVDTLRK